MLPERDQYESLLESVADGANVDWAALDAAAATNAERKRYRNLRLVARVAELHRTLVLEEEDRSLTSLDDDAALADPATWGHLSIASRLASGAFGQIYLAHDPQLNRPVALKLLRTDITLLQPVDRLLGEARTLAQVRHPNVVTVHGADVRDRRAGLWMELVDGQTLEAWLGTHGAMGAGEATAIGIDLCRALAAVHGQELVHGDVKAQNVMREKGGRIVLMDFGAGRAQGADAAGVAGTPMYLAPEVLAGAPPTPESDLYSLGILLFHLLTRKFPYSALDLETLRAAHADGERTWVRDLRPDLPHALVLAIERAIDSDPARRFASAGAMERALALHQDTVPVVEQRSFPIPATRPAPLRWSRLAFTLTAAALLMVVVGLIVWSRTMSPNRGAVLSSIRTIGVMPMVNSTGSGLPDHFAEGLTEEVISALGQVHALTVKSGSSLGSIEGKPDKEIAQALDVDALLKTIISSADGNSSGESPRLKVQARLLAAGTQGIVWSQDFYGRRGSTSSLANAIATAVTREVKGTLTSAESARLTSVKQTSPEAEEAFLIGRSHIEGYGGASAEAALEAFQRALKLDPQHAAAHAGAARAYEALGANGAIPHTQARMLALAEARQSLDFDPDLSEAHAVLGHIHFIYDWDWPGAEREFTRSLELNPSSTYALAYYANFLASQARFEESLAKADAARKLDPHSGQAARNYALFLYYKRDYSAAEQVLADSAAIESNQVGPLLRGRIAEAQGDFDGALSDIRQALQLSRGAVVPLRVAEIRAAALAGRRAEALASLAALQREADTRKIRLSLRDLAYIQLAFGDKAKAIELFEQAVSDSDPTMVWLGVDPRVDSLRGEPRFRQLLKTIGLPAGAEERR
jgi:serine/threonine protein kinase/tetratricopeptide (TPR) repeat protein